MVYKKLHLKEIYPFLGENGADPVLECYLPYNMAEMNRSDDRRPCILICPGGGYCFCSEREAEPIALKFLAYGYNAFIITYSVKDYRFPTQLREVAAAMEMIYANSREWNCDTEKIAIAGFSAGGHLAAHYSNFYNCEEVRKVFPESKRVNASVLCYPVICSDKGIAHEGSFEALVGHYPLTAEEGERFSCEKTVSADTPPAFIWHTAKDDCVPVMNSLLYAQSLAKYGIDFSLHVFPYGGHGLSTADHTTCDNIDEKNSLCASWIDEAAKWLSLAL